MCRQMTDPDRDLSDRAGQREGRRMQFHAFGNHVYKRILLLHGRLYFHTDAYLKAIRDVLGRTGE